MNHQVIPLLLFAILLLFIMFGAGYATCYHSESRKMKYYCVRENCRTRKDERCKGGHCTEHCNFSSMCNGFCQKMWREEQTFIQKIHNS